MTAISLLIVEENPADLLIVKEYLSENRNNTFTFLEARSLHQALRLITHHNPDAILLDIQLQDSSGLDTIREVISNAPETAVIVLTGLQNEEMAVQAVRYGAQDFLSKRDLSPTMLSRSIRYSIERKKVLQEKEDLLHDLDLAFERINTLENLLPLCSGCNKIHGQDRRWYPLEEYEGPSILASHPEELICPDCRAALDNETHQTNT
ncbi:MAG: response regulator [Desulfopila sp.]|jgi:DNA-binding NtrC family response regulator|nr:response regulator [Desulfopila sp.]